MEQQKENKEIIIEYIIRVNPPLLFGAFPNNL